MSTLIKIYKNVIYSDIDTIWISDPRPYFKGTSIDFWAQIDGLIEGSPYFEGFVPFICTGFLALKSTPKTLEMLKKWQKVVAENKLDQEQNLLQKIAFELSVNFGVLPIRQFPYGLIYFDTMRKHERGDVVILHNNYVFGKAKKIQRFRDYQLWAPEFLQSSNCQSEKLLDIMKKSIFRCLPDDATLAKNSMDVHPGKVLLTEKYLMNAIQKEMNDFKMDIGKYFYDATLHWKTNSALT